MLKFVVYSENHGGVVWALEVFKQSCDGVLSLCQRGKLDSEAGDKRLVVRDCKVIREDTDDAPRSSRV